MTIPFDKSYVMFSRPMVCHIYGKVKTSLFNRHSRQYTSVVLQLLPLKVQLFCYLLKIKNSNEMNDQSHNKKDVCILHTLFLI